MIKPFTCVCFLMAAGSGLYLYQTKHRSQMLDREIGRTLKQTEAARDRIGVLRGEWALLNEPERLAELTQQHLTLRTLAPTQFAAMADLGNRLPAPLPQGRAQPAEEATETPAPIAALAKPTPGRVTQTAAQTPAPTQTTAQTPSAAPARAVAVAPAARPAPVQTAAAPIPLNPASAMEPAQTMAALPVPPSAARARASGTAVASAGASGGASSGTSASALAHPLPLPAPVPVQSTSQGRFMAPLVSVSATPMGTPTAAAARVQTLAATRPSGPGTSIGESVARTARAHASLQQANAAPAAPAYTGSALPVSSYGASPAESHGLGVSSGMGSAMGTAQGTALGTALGGARTALPAPVPYGAASR
ncbi:MAG: cell division protein FtsL [Janthinobacterium lividum]